MLLQPAKADPPIFLTVPGIVMEFKLVQSLKALIPISSKRLPKVAEARLEHPLKADSPIFRAEMLIEVNLLQRAKARSAIIVTDDGIVAEVRLLQFQNAPSSMFVTPLGISTALKLRQLRKAYSFISVTVLHIETETSLWQS
jgi:hypothetical protein